MFHQWKVGVSTPASLSPDANMMPPSHSLYSVVALTHWHTGMAGGIGQAGEPSPSSTGRGVRQGRGQGGR